MAGGQKYQRAGHREDRPRLETRRWWRLVITWSHPLHRRGILLFRPAPQPCHVSLERRQVVYDFPHHTWHYEGREGVLRSAQEGWIPFAKPTRGASRPSNPTAEEECPQRACQHSRETEYHVDNLLVCGRVLHVRTTIRRPLRPHYHVRDWRPGRNL